MSGYNPLKWQQQQTLSPGTQAPQLQASGLAAEQLRQHAPPLLGGGSPQAAAGVAAARQQAHSVHAVGVAQGQGGVPPLPQHAQQAGADAAANDSGTLQLPGVAGLLLARGGTPPLQQAAAPGQQQPAPAPAPAAPQPAGSAERRVSRGLPPGFAQQPHPQPQPQPQPRHLLQHWLAKLQREVSPPCVFSWRDAVRWLQGFAPEVHQLLAADSKLRDYLQAYVLERHGPGVLACLAFFALGHPAEFRGASVGLHLSTSVKPAALVNQRLSFYRVLFGNCPAKADALASVIAHRPDVACQLSDNAVRRLFGQPPRGAYAAPAVERMEATSDLAPLAALLLLPVRWQAACRAAGREPQEWLTSYVSTVMQSSSDADRWVALLSRHMPEQSRQPLQQPAHAVSPLQPAASSSPSSPPPAAQPQPQSPQPPAASDKAGQVTELALVQLQLERPDVVACASKALRDEISAMPWQRALSVIGALSDLPKDWEALMTPAQRTAHLSAVVKRTAAAVPSHGDSADTGAGAGAGAGWLAAARGSGRPRSSAGAAAAGGAAAAAAAAPAASRPDAPVYAQDWLQQNGRPPRFASQAEAMAWIKAERRAVHRALDERNRSLLSELGPQQQLYALEIIGEITDQALAKCAEPASYLVVALRRMVFAFSRPLSSELQAGLARLQAERPGVARHVDAAVFLFLVGLKPHQSQLALEALFAASNMHSLREPQHYLLDKMNKAIKAAAA